MSTKIKQDSTPDGKVELISLRCLECGQETPIAANSIYFTTVGINYFCHQKDCEDRYAFKQ